MPFVSLAPLDAEFLGAALANAPVFCLPDAGHGPALLTVAAALGAQAAHTGMCQMLPPLSLQCGKISECKGWDIEGDGSLLSILYLEETRTWHMYI